MALDQADRPAAAKPAQWQAPKPSPVDDSVSASPSPPAPGFKLPIVCSPQCRQAQHDNEMAAAEE